MTLILSSLIRQLFRIDTGDPSTDLPVAQIRVCSILYEGARSMSAVSRELGTSLSAMTQIADRLERAGLVERVADPEDRRMKSLQLTPQGSEMMRRRVEMRTSRVTEVLEQLPVESRESIISSMEALLNASRSNTPSNSNDSINSKNLEILNT